ncbi:MAG: serine/threonine-protein kinase, partial [Ghiorsea sp.]|nr:serine/threonine-protein kinase [Ghiorsea sp.]
SAVKLSYPFAKLSEVSVGIGYLNVLPSYDGVLRSEPLIVEYYGKFFPSMSLAMVAYDLNLTMNDVLVNIGHSVELGTLVIPTDEVMQVAPKFYADLGDKEGQAFRHISFYDLKAGKVPLHVLKDKIVLIGVTAVGIGEGYPTPVSNDMNAIDYHANVIESLLNSSFITTPEWAGIVGFVLLLVVGFYLAIVLPRLSAFLGAVVTFSSLLVMLGYAYVSLADSGVWVSTIAAASLLAVGYIVLTIKRFSASEDDRAKISSESAETNKMLALSFQSQGMLDMAFDKFRKCPPADDILDGMYTLALDFERKRQFNKAAAVYEYILEHNPKFKDVKQRMQRTKDAGESMVFGGAGGGMGTLMITGGAKPTLGRYEIIKEIGKGAMGTVYLGKDPKINRDVAIKTMALSQEFEGDELQDVKDRFFREAETAGMLNHPNIVTMYDAGEEHDLAFIAMEFLDGTDLAPYTKKGKLLPQMATLKIVGKVAEALHYASKQHVVHRDIKPANIMLLKNKSVKVTDFGIARITASSKTKTGIVLGTPSYMSPEQLSGKHVDGRSDIFSLGVMLYEMLVGQRPFKGDSMATLLFQIANEPHPDIREFDPNLPQEVSTLINNMLEKNPDKRLPNGGAVIRGIIACLKVMAAKDGRK